MEAIKNKNLVERFSSYINHVRENDRKSSAFTQKLAERTETRALEPRQKAKDRSSVGHHPNRAGRRSQPPTNLGQTRKITSVQARRLARYAPVIEFCAKKYNVPVELICGVILQESGGNPRAVSHCGARGLMQLMPGTAKRFGVKNSFDPVQNIDGGTRYLRFLLDKFEGKMDLALAGYNAGEGNVVKYGNRIPPFAETRGYVPAVLGYTQTLVNFFALKGPALPANARRV
ncbi:MAG TPA: lytic transglycosylase domain-containing protein [bacterium]|nr:lytic transglycosylase domain-containing protein [bacterium]